MTDWVQIKNPAADPKVLAATVSVKAWDRVYKPRGWKLVKGDNK